MKQDEHGLRDVVRQMRIAQPPASRPVHPPDVPANQLRERTIVAIAVAMVGEQFGIGATVSMGVGHRGICLAEQQLPVQSPPAVIPDNDSCEVAG